MVFDVMGCEALKGNELSEGIVVESTDEGEGQKKDSFLYLSGKSREQRNRAVAVEYPRYETGREETAKEFGDKIHDGGVIRRIGNETNMKD